MSSVQASASSAVASASSASGAEPTGFIAPLAAGVAVVAGVAQYVLY